MVHLPEMKLFTHLSFLAKRFLSKFKAYDSKYFKTKLFGLNSHNKF